MGPLKKPDINLRAWGCTENLEIKGMLEVELENEKGAKTSSKVYVVEGYEAEPLLGDKDAEELGFIIFNREGREPTLEECASINRVESNIPQKLRDNLNISVDTKPVVDVSNQLTPKGRKDIEEVVDRYKGSVFDDTKIGCMKTSLYSSIMMQTSNYDSHHSEIFPISTKNESVDSSDS